MTAFARLFVFTLTLVALGSGSACLTTLCLSALCGDPQANARPLTLPTAAETGPATDRSDHDCNLMRF
jgi:hypothetical protein